MPEAMLCKAIRCAVINAVEQLDAVQCNVIAVQCNAIAVQCNVIAVQCNVIAVQCNVHRGTM